MKIEKFVNDNGCYTISIRTDNGSYTITIRRVVIDDESLSEARVKEFPDLIDWADTHDEVWSLIIDSILTTESIFIDKSSSV